MTKFEKNSEIGELWLRTPSGAIYPATSALSAVYSKYKIVDSTFYSELSNNQIKRFDFFYDVVFIETNSGHIFDKIEILDNHIIPVNQDNRFFDTRNQPAFPDYWLDETNKKIYNVINKIYSWTLSSTQIDVIIEQFDIVRNLFGLKLNYQINLNFGQNIYSSKPILEPPKITYNIDTKTFNVSFILRGPNKDFGLISTNLIKEQILNVSEVYSILPYTSSKNISVDIIEQKTLETDFYS